MTARILHIFCDRPATETSLLVPCLCSEDPLLEYARIVGAMETTKEAGCEICSGDF